MERYRYITDQDFERCDLYIARGWMQPRAPFELKPKFHPDGSVEFKQSMLIPAVLWVGLAFCIAITWFELQRNGGLGFTHWSIYWAAGGCMLMILCALQTARSWTSIRIRTDGTLTFLYLRRTRRECLGIPADQAKLANAIVFQRPGRVKNRPYDYVSTHVLNPGYPKHYAVNGLIVIIEDFALPLVIDKDSVQATVTRLLGDDYGFHLQADVVLYQHKPLVP